MSSSNYKIEKLRILAFLENGRLRNACEIGIKLPKNFGLSVTTLLGFMGYLFYDWKMNNGIKWTKKLVETSHK